MRVILMRDVRHTGRRGEVIDVKAGYARNYLVPRGMALEATPGNQKYYEQQKRKIEVRHLAETEAAETAAAELQATSRRLRRPRPLRQSSRDSRSRSASVSERPTRSTDR